MVSTTMLSMFTDKTALPLVVAAAISGCMAEDFDETAAVSQPTTVTLGVDMILNDGEFKADPNEIAQREVYMNSGDRLWVAGTSYATFDPAGTPDPSGQKPTFEPDSRVLQAAKSSGKRISTAQAAHG
jgi:chorismate-pyruvate lyase